MPFICCSMTEVTVSCKISAEAPAYVAVTEIEGGAMLGYWATGNLVIARAPISTMRMETTQAKTGRSMKNLAMTKIVWV